MTEIAPKTRLHADEKKELEFRISKLELGPDDILVLRFKERISEETIKVIREQIKPLIGSRKCMVLENSADLAVLTVEAA